jgi:CxxC motif-containing protein (DUF1111 family)
VKYTVEEFGPRGIVQLQKDNRSRAKNKKISARLICGVILVTLAAAVAFAQQSQEAPAGFDNQTNGLVDQKTHVSDQAPFDRVLEIPDGLGPLYNAQSCHECHQNPTSGGASQVSVLRVGHLDASGHFQNPEIPIAHGEQTVKGRSLINDRSICPDSDSPNTEIQERVPDSETIRSTHMSLNLLGDGFVEAIPDQTLLDIAQAQCKKDNGRICGEAIRVPIVEAPGQMGIGKFGWKDQHASLLSFAGDAYINEMGITTRLFPTEIEYLCNTVREPNEFPGADGLENVDLIARFVRATKVPARDSRLADSPSAAHGAEVFAKIGCATCHVPTLATAPAGTKINGGAYTISPELGGKTFHPYGDFLLHNVGTGDGIVMFVSETSPRTSAADQANSASPAAPDYQDTQNKIRTAPLWGVRLRPRLMHDGGSLTLSDAILRHQGEALHVTQEFQKLNHSDQQALLDFLKSL